MSDVIAAGPGFVAVGMWYDGEFEGAIWSSADGARWERHSIDDSGGFGDGVSSVAVGSGGTVVAVGTAGTMPAAWFSTDGQRWEPVEGNWSLESGESASLQAVTHSGGQFVAIGRVVPSQTHAVWRSANGRSWERVDVNPEAFQSGESVSALTAGGPGLLAVGYVFGPPDTPMIWSSVDGRTWDRTPLEGVPEARLYGIAALADGAVAVGSLTRDGDFSRSSGAVWYSTDARTWTLTSQDLGLDGTTTLWTVEATTDGVLAAGSDGGVATVWTSQDGASWQPSLQQGLQDRGASVVPWRSIHAVAEGRAATVAVGSASYEPGRQGTTVTVWVR